MVAVGGAPRVFGNEEEGAVATAAHKTDEGHAMVVGGEATLKHELTLLLRAAAHGQGEVCHAVGPTEAALTDVALPTHGVAVEEQALYHGHHRVERQVQELLVQPVVGHLKVKRLAKGMVRERGDGLPLAWRTDALGEVDGRIFCPEHIDMQRHGTHALVKQSLNDLLVTPKRRLLTGSKHQPTGNRAQRESGLGAI